MQLEIFDVGERVRFIRDGRFTHNGHVYYGPQIVEGTIARVKIDRRKRWDYRTREEIPSNSVRYWVDIMDMSSGTPRTVRVTSQRQHSFQRVVPLAPAAPTP